MLYAYLDDLLQYYTLLCCLFWLFAGYAYRVNAKRPADDPQKKDFHIAAVFLPPIAWPLFILGFVSLLILKTILYCIFLMALTFALVVIRKPFIFIWLDKIATKIGNIILEANTQLVKLFLSLLPKRSQQV